MERIGHRVDQQCAFEPRERTHRIVPGQQSGGGPLRPRRNIPGRLAERFGQHRLRERHGTGPVARHAGSNGATSTPSRVFPGKRLPGHMGFVRVTVQNLTVVKVDTENNLIAVKGAVPGSKGTIVTLANSVKA